MRQMTGLLLFLMLLSSSCSAGANEKALSFSSVEKEQQFVRLTHDIRCVVCQSQSIAESDALLAKDLRRKVYEQTEAGWSEQAIKQYLVERYGESILFSPPFNTRTMILWGFPFLLLAMIAIFFMWATWRRR